MAVVSEGGGKMVVVVARGKVGAAVVEINLVLVLAVTVSAPNAVKKNRMWLDNAALTAFAQNAVQG